MISSSAEFTAATNAANRIPKLKIDVLWTDPFVQSGNTASSPHVNNFCDLDSAVVDDLLLHTVDTKTETPFKYVINDGTLINDGTFYPVPGSIEDAAYNQVGWYTSGVSDSSGDFSTPQELTISFAEKRTIKQLIVVGEPTLSEYPVDFDVYIYDEYDNVLNSVTNFSGSSVTTSLDFVSDNINTATYMKLVINTWSEVNTIGKIVEFFGVITDTFYSNDIVSMDILEEMQCDDEITVFGNMSINEIDVELQNISIEKDGSTVIDPLLPDNANSYLKNSVTKNVRITPYIGFVLDDSDSSIEYIKMGVYWSTDWDVSESDFLASVTARDRLEILRNNTFLADEILESASLKEVAEYVLNHAKVNIPLNDLTWEINDDLYGYNVEYVWFGKVTYFEALSKITSACLGKCYCDRDGKIIIEAYTSDQIVGSPNFTIPATMWFSQSKKMQDIKNYIVVPVCPLAPEDEAGDVYTSDDVNIDSTETTITESISWGDDAVIEHDVVIDPTESVGVTVVKTAATYYPWGAVITFQNMTGTTGTFKYKVTGKKLIPTEGIDPITVQDPNSISLYNKQEHEVSDNYLIQSTDFAQVIADAMLTSQTEMWREIEIETQGNPCYECGDVANIEVYSKQAVYSEFRVVRQKFKADRDTGLRCDLTCKKTIDYGS